MAEVRADLLIARAFEQTQACLVRREDLGDELELALPRAQPSASCIEKRLPTPRPRALTAT